VQVPFPSSPASSAKEKGLTPFPNERNGQGLPHWTPWNTRQEPYLVFSQNGDAVPQRSFSPIYFHLSPDRLKEQLADF